MTETRVAVALLQQINMSGGSIVKRKVLVLLMAVAFLAGVRTYAHHSFAATYFEDKKVTIEGEHITPDHKAIITPDGHLIPNKTEVSVED